MSDGWFIDPTISFIELICSISGYTPALSALPWAACFGAVPTAPVSTRFSVWSTHGTRDVIALLDLASPGSRQESIQVCVFPTLRILSDHLIALDFQPGFVHWGVAESYGKFHLDEGRRAITAKLADAKLYVGFAPQDLA